MSFIKPNILLRFSAYSFLCLFRTCSTPFSKDTYTESYSCFITVIGILTKLCLSFYLELLLKMLCLYLSGKTCLHLTFQPYLSSETYSRKYKNLPNIVIHACTNNTEKCNCWKCLARKFGFVYFRFNPLRRNS